MTGMQSIIISTKRAEMSVSDPSSPVSAQKECVTCKNGELTLEQQKALQEAKRCALQCVSAFYNKLLTNPLSIKDKLKDWFALNTEDTGNISELTKRYKAIEERIKNAPLCYTGEKYMGRTTEAKEKGWCPETKIGKDFFESDNGLFQNIFDQLAKLLDHLQHNQYYQVVLNLLCRL